MKMYTYYQIFLLVISNFIFVVNTLAQENNSFPFVSTNDKISIDGRLDEAAWSLAPVISDFVQQEPYEGSEVDEETEVRILFGEHAVFIAAKMYQEKGRIQANSGPRDRYNKADWFMVSIDSYYDKKTAFTFAVNAGGVQLDGQQDDNKKLAVFDRDPLLPEGLDVSWDAIWYSEVALAADHWIVEMQIPYSMLRFSNSEGLQTWGIYFNRRVPEVGEVSEWPYIPRNVRMNLVANYGRIENIRDIRSKKNIQVRPYILSGVDLFESSTMPDHTDSKFKTTSGADLKLSIGSGATLDVTFNPDFGQVEADPAVLNLTAFETFFPEKRPFFLEGADIFKFGIGSSRLFYSRRLGGESPIITAAKLSGSAKGGLSYGLLGASEGSKFRSSKNYGIARASQRLGQYSSIGGMVTYFYSPDKTGTGWKSITGGIDWDLQLGDNGYHFEGIVAFSNRDPLIQDKKEENGFMTGLVFRKTKGILDGHATMLLFSDRYNPNDIGWISYEQNWYQLWVNAKYKLNNGKPFGRFQRGDLMFGLNQRISYLEGYNMGGDFSVTPVLTTLSFETFKLGGHIYDVWGGYDLWETRGLWIWSKPAAYEVSAEYGTDSRKKWQIGSDIKAKFDELRGKEYNLSVNGNFNVGRRFSLETNIGANFERNKKAWASNESFTHSANEWKIGEYSASPSDLTPEDYHDFEDNSILNSIMQEVIPYSGVGNQYYVPVFGNRNTSSLDLAFRGSLSFGKKFSIQEYIQFFVAKGVYNNPSILADPDHLIGFDQYPKKRSFNYKNLQSNFVARWEYRPGSNIYLVWTQSRDDRHELNPLAPYGDKIYRQNTFRQFSDIFRIFPNNSIMIKIDYVFY